MNGSPLLALSRRRLLAMLALLTGTLAAGAVGMVAVQRGPDSASPAAAEPAALAALADPAAVSRGAYLARLGHCAGCHTARGGSAYAGGRGMATPFGTVYAGNLTPDASTGLGRWSADDFWQALHHGRSRDGRLLTPAFPYTQFTQVSRQDSNDLFAYLRSLPPVVQPNRPHGLRFPFNTQAALVVWRALYFTPAVFTPDTARSPAWNRGAYLVRGLGHCAACHAPRNALGATRNAEALAGGRLPMQPWWAPALAPARPGGLDAQQLVALLQTGQSASGTAAGPMAEVVVQSTQHWTRADLQAVATYLQALPPVAPARASTATVPAEVVALGAQLYAHHCAACHGPNGEGAAGAYPPLAGNPSVTMADPGNLVQAVLHGGFAPATTSHPQPYGMPPQPLSDAEVAAVLSHVRRAWGNAAAPVSVMDVVNRR